VAGFLAGHRDRTTAAGGRGKMAGTMSRGAIMNDIKNGTMNDTVMTEKAGGRR
jgi:hypothetical protein